MDKDPGIPTIAKTVIALIVITVAATGSFFVFRYLQQVSSFSVSLTGSASTKQVSFDLTIFDNAVQVQVTVNSDTSLWQASVVNSQGNIV